jgi:hypothetical protein
VVSWYQHAMSCLAYTYTRYLGSRLVRGVPAFAWVEPGATSGGGTEEREAAAAAAIELGMTARSGSAV